MIPKEWSNHDYLVRKVIRKIINKYNMRIAKHLAYYMGENENYIISLIDGMEDNKWQTLNSED